MSYPEAIMKLSTSRKILGALITIFSAAAIVTAQTAQSEAQSAKASLRISGEVERQLTLSGDDLAKLPRRSTRAKDHSGKESEFEGVPLVEILKQAGVKFGEGLRGKNLELYLVVEAADGYRAVYALPELDPAYTDKTILLAEKRDGKPMDAKEGPLRIIAPDEKRHARWVRQVTGLVIKRAQ
jgi:DMSO/TMAO reductase YedYZ molybdopterin-dependent catalytic subunit